MDVENMTDQDLEDLILKSCTELSGREKNRQAYQLNKALELWPALHESLRAKGKVVGLNDNARPVAVVWADQSMVSLAGYYNNKPKTKKEAFEIVKRTGHSHWASMGELWLWLADAGPIMERGMQEFGYKFL